MCRTEKLHFRRVCKMPPRQESQLFLISREFSVSLHEQYTQLSLPGSCTVISGIHCPWLCPFQSLSCSWSLFSTGALHLLSRLAFQTHKTTPTQPPLGPSPLLSCGCPPISSLHNPQGLTPAPSSDLSLKSNSLGEPLRSP